MPDRDDGLGARARRHHLMSGERYIYALTGWTVEKRPKGWYFAPWSSRHNNGGWRGPYRSEASVAMLIRRVATFSEFTEDNDPHGEHDFGNFTLAGRKFFWKIDAYDANMQFGSEDPADPTKTTRVLTIMLAEEY